MSTRSSLFTLVAITTLITAALAPAGASAHGFGGGGFGGGVHSPMPGPVTSAPVTVVHDKKKINSMPALLHPRHCSLAQCGW